MKTTVEALQDYYVEAGGQLADVADITTIPDMIDAITALGGGSGSSLPAVTSDDNGKLLTVVEGSWDKANAPTTTPFVINVTEDAEYEITLDKTYAQIEAAYNSGARLVVNLTRANDGYFGGSKSIPLNGAAIQEDHPTLDFCPINVGDGVTYIGNVVISCSSEYTTINVNEIS